MPLEKDFSGIVLQNAAHEIQRVKALMSYELLNSQRVQELDDLTELASLICDTPIAAITLIDDSKQWLKSKKGLSMDFTERSSSICQHTMMGNDLLEIYDTTKHALFKSNPLVTNEPYIRFYAGYPLIDPDGFALGSLCVIDHQPKELNAKQKESLRLLADAAVSHIISIKEKSEKSHFEELFNRSIDMVCIAGADGYFKKVNPAFSVTLGWTIKELMEKPFIDFVHPDDKNKTFNEIQKLSAGLRTVSFENRYLTRSGEYKVLSWVANPDAKKGFIYAIARDQTLQMATQQKFILAEKKFRDFFENSPDAFFVEDHAGNIIDLNAAAATMHSLPAEQLIGKNIRALVPRNEYLNILRNYKSLFLGSLKTVESKIWKDLNTELPIEITGKKIIYNDNPVMLLNVRDITERKKLEAERIRALAEKRLMQEEKMQSALKILVEERNRIAAEMHDEMGADLSRISILGQVIKKSSSNKNIILHINKILNASAKMQETIGNIVWCLDPKNDTLENLISYINYYLSEFLESSSIQLNIIIPKKIPAINVNSKLRRTIFLFVKESVNNLIKYSEATNVRIEINTGNNFFSLSIRDNGIGFNPNDLPRFSNGINNMKHRVTEIGGEIIITSKKLSGTSVLLNVPLSE